VPLAAVIENLLEEQLVDPAVRHDLGSVARGERQDHVEGSQLSIVATAEVAKSAPDALVGVAVRNAVVAHAELLGAPPKGQVAAGDLRLRHRGDAQQLPDVVEVRDQVVVTELGAEPIVPVPDHRPRWLEGERVVDRRRAAHQLAGHDGGRDRRELHAEDLEHGVPSWPSRACATTWPSSSRTSAYNLRVSAESSMTSAKGQGLMRASLLHRVSATSRDGDGAGLQVAW
jgi:hypothetical protein